MISVAGILFCFTNYTYFVLISSFLQYLFKVHKSVLVYICFNTVNTIKTEASFEIKASIKGRMDL